MSGYEPDEYEPLTPDELQAMMHELPMGQMLSDEEIEDIRKLGDMVPSLQKAINRIQAAEAMCVGLSSVIVALTGENADLRSELEQLRSSVRALQTKKDE